MTSPEGWACGTRIPSASLVELMPMHSAVPIFDGHNDVLLRLARRIHPHPERIFLDGEALGHLDLPRMRAGHLAGGLFAVFVPSGDDPRIDEMMAQARYDIPLPPQLELSAAQRVTLHMVALLFRIERASRGQVKVCRTAGEIRQCLDSGVLAPVLHIEGAEAIDPDLYMLEVLHQSGLRSLGLVWSRNNIFGHGVPFRYPSGPDLGPGLTERGRDLVRACNRLRIAIDCSHLNEKGFWDVASLSDAPLIATHSNTHAVCPHSRNLTDRQLAAIRDSRGIVGVNFATAFVRPDGRRDPNTPLEDLIRHLDHLIEHLGIEGVGFGSDFDGATIPARIGDARGLPRLLEAMQRHGYDEPTLRKLAHENWLGVLQRTWGA